MTKFQITKTMIDQLEYDAKEMCLKSPAVISTDAGSKSAAAAVLFVFADSDLNAAAYHLAKSLENPFSANAVATVLMQESICEDFIAILQPKLSTYSEEVIPHAGFKQALDLIEKMQAKTVVAAGAGSANSPVLVYDITHDALGQNATGVVTLHTFRTAKESISLCIKESLIFENVSIWNQNHSCAYELVAALRCRNFFINCYDVSLEPLSVQSSTKENFVTIDKSHHYETLQHEGIHKSIVFPIGTIFAN